MYFPSYAIAIIIILVIVSISTSVYFILRKRRRGGTVDAVREQSEEYITEKNTASPYAVKPLIGYNNNNIDTSSTNKDGTSSTSTIPPTTNYFEKSNDVYENKSMEDNSSSVWTTTDNGTPLPPSSSDVVDIKISLPLPPPNTSFFSDKMELDSSEANELYTSYMNVAAQQEYVSIDLDDKPFLSNAAANIQQKAATLRSTLKQSMRRKSTSGVPKVSLNQFFDNANGTTNGSSVKSSRPESTRMSRQSSSTPSIFPTRSSLQQPAIPPSPRPDSPASEFFGKFSNNSSKKSLAIPDEMNSSSKLMVENIPADSYFSLPMTPSTPSPSHSPLTMKPTIQQQQELAQQQQQEYIMHRQQALAQKQQEEYSSIISEINNNDLPSVASSSDEAEDEEAPDNDDESSQQDAAVAARKLIRSASRKSRTRSMLVSEEAAQNMMAMIANATPSPSATAESPTTAINAPRKFGTLRKHNMEIDTNPSRGSSNNTSDMDIKNWSKNNDSPISPSPKRAIMSSTLSGSATVSGKKMARQQILAANLNNSSDNLYSSRNTESITLGRKSGGDKKDGSTSLRNLFTRPDDNKVAPMVISKEEPVQKKEPLTIATASSTMVESEDDSQSMNTPSSPIVPDSPSSSKNNTLRKMGSNVDTIRRMLQSSWSGNNLKESGSSSSLSSSDYMGSVGSSYRPIASPLGSVNPRLQNQHLVSLSLKANAVQQRSRPSMPVDFMNNGEGPIPTASFSSSTVRTMIPADEEETERSKPKSVVSGLLGSRQPRQPSRLGENGRTNKKTQTGKKTPAQIEREKYLKSLET